jgi:N-formylglutamate amidohydrolase
MNTNNIILNIPHASTKLPQVFFRNIIIEKDKVQNFNNAITDLYIDKLFMCNRQKCIKAKYSRIFCDVEKFADDKKEIMSRYGMGAIYSHTNKGEKFINLGVEYKNNILQNYYFRYHKKLDNLVENQLTKNQVVLIDCHSFSKEIIMQEDKRVNLPDICIGFDNMYYSEQLVNFIKLYFTNLGYSVNFNYPYEGTMIPNKFYGKKIKNLYCVMIEINKRIYLDEFNKKNKNYYKLKKQIRCLLEILKYLIIE